MSEQLTLREIGLIMDQYAGRMKVLAERMQSPVRIQGRELETALGMRAITMQMHLLMDGVVQALSQGGE
jgi:hypothetical protein